VSDCLFCKIIAGKIPSNQAYEDELCFGFHDIAPKAPLHVLFVPKEHFASASEIDEGREKLAGHLLRVAGELARQRGYGQSGYRLILNTGPNAGQTVFHLHLHLLAGKPLAEMG
jgi:diadenosine tetraphosphate (Ap4A) HIT family hydrolase